MDKETFIVKLLLLGFQKGSAFDHGPLSNHYVKRFGEDVIYVDLGEKVGLLGSGHKTIVTWSIAILGKYTARLPPSGSDKFRTYEATLEFVIKLMQIREEKDGRKRSDWDNALSFIVKHVMGDEQ